MKKIKTIEEGVTAILNDLEKTVEKSWKYLPATGSDLVDTVIFDGEEIPLFWWRYDNQIFPLEKYEREIEEAKEFLLKLGFGTNITIQKDKAGIKDNAVSIVEDGIELYMPFEGLVDMEQERKRLQEEKKRLESEVARCEKMLSNPGFMNKAPQSKIDEEKAKLEKYKDMLAKVEESLK